jgi:hypothetical protein
MRFGKKAQSDIVPSEIGRALLSIAVIVVLILLAVLIFNIFAKNQKLEQAKSSLNEIEMIAQSLSEGEVRDFLVESPKEWVIVKPYDSESKLCYCPSTFSSTKSAFSVGTANFILQKDLCVGSGVCVDLGKEVMIEDTCYDVPDCFLLESLPSAIKISRVNDVIKLSLKDSYSASTFMYYFLGTGGRDFLSKWVNSGYDSAQGEEVKTEINKRLSEAKVESYSWCIKLVSGVVEVSGPGFNYNELSSSDSLCSDWGNSYKRMISFSDSQGNVKTYTVFFKFSN